MKKTDSRSLKNNMILVTGANGQLGMELQKLLTESGIPYEALNSQQLDITDKEQVNTVFDKLEPTIVYDCAAYTAVDAAEDSPGIKINQLVNVDGTRNLAVAAERIGATLVYVSTDYVFDGNSFQEYTENAPTNPKNEYGRAKRDGELVVQGIMSRYYIIRTSWVFGQYGNNFVYTMLRLAESHNELSVVDDQLGRPTWTRTLAEFMLFAIQHGVSYGLYNFSNEGQCSWYDFAKQILSDSDIVIQPVDSQQYPQRAYRPRHTVMSLEKVRQTGFDNISWQQALSKFLNSICG